MTGKDICQQMKSSKLKKKISVRKSKLQGILMHCPSMWPKQFWLVQNGFGLTKLIWTWPEWFGHDQNEMVRTKMNWSGPNCDFLPKWITFGPDQFILVVTISFWSWPNHYGQVQINLVRPKPFWTDQNCFGHIEGQGIRLLKRKLCLSSIIIFNEFFFYMIVSKTMQYFFFHAQWLFYSQIIRIISEFI